MKTSYRMAIAVLAGIGAGAVETLRAQAKPPAYIVAEIDVSNQEPYQKEYVPLAVKALEASGAKYLARGGKTAVIDGDPPKRVVIATYESLDKAQAAYSSAAYKDARKIGEKYAKFRIFAIEGLAP